MTRTDLARLRQCLQLAPVQFLLVRPRGFELPPERRLRPRLLARILGYGNARTRLHNRQPACRSLDGIRSTGQFKLRCAQCDLHHLCTPQLRLDLIAQRRPWRLLLDNTNSKRFFLYDAQLRQRALVLEDLIHCIDVIDRGSWGELRFSAVRGPRECSPTPRATPEHHPHETYPDEPP